MTLRGKIALVTGAGSGIGRASSLALARAGCSLVLTGRREAALQQTAAMIHDAGGCEPSLVVPADLTQASSVGNLFDSIEKERGRLDILFNNAGALRGRRRKRRTF